MAAARAPRPSFASRPASGEQAGSTRHRCGLVALGLEEALLPPPPAQPVEAVLRRDAGEPRPERQPVVVAAQRRAQLHEHLAGGVLGVLPLPEQVKAESEHAAGGAPVQLAEGLAVALTGATNHLRGYGVFRGVVGHHFRNTSREGRKIA